MLQEQIHDIFYSLFEVARTFASPSALVNLFPLNSEVIEQLYASVIALMFVRLVRDFADPNYLGGYQPMSKLSPNAYFPRHAPRAPTPVAPEAFATAFEEDDVFDAMQERAAPRRIVQDVTEAAVRSTAEQLADASRVKFYARTAFSDCEADLRRRVQSCLPYGDGSFVVMARTALSAVLSPAAYANRDDRNRASAAIENKYIDLGIFTADGRLVLALEIVEADYALRSERLKRSVTQQALAQAGIPYLSLSPEIATDEVAALIAPYLPETNFSEQAAETVLNEDAQATDAELNFDLELDVQMQNLFAAEEHAEDTAQPREQVADLDDMFEMPQTQEFSFQRPGRPVRPVRPTRGANLRRRQRALAFAAE